MKYRPEPMDTSMIVLTKDIAELVELLAANAHAIWAQERTLEGWTYGPQRDDRQKEHPDLVPYKDLPESEKDYDRKIAMETIKVILALGYRIEK